MESLWQWFGFAILMAAVLWLLCGVLFRAYFTAKEDFLDRLARKVRKEIKDGKDQ
jgi:hypothetical protein